MVEHQRVRDARAVELLEYLFVSEQDRVVNLITFNKRPNALQPILIQSNTNHLDFGIGGKLFQVGHLAPAWLAPRRPEIYNHDITFKRAALNCAAIERGQ